MTELTGIKGRKKGKESKMNILPLLEVCHVGCIFRILLDMLDIRAHGAAENITERKSSNA